MALKDNSGTPDIPLLQVWVTGALCRVVIAILWVTVQHADPADVAYYWERTYRMREVGLGATLREYPTPVTWLLSIPQLVGGSRAGYILAFVALMLLVDVAFCLALWRFGGPKRGQAITFWSLFLVAMGPLVWLRFDLVPAIAVGAAALLALQHPMVSGALLALGASVKLWPGALITLFVNRRSGWRTVASFTVTGLFLAVVSVWAGGWDRLMSPLRWQSGRGLQVESIWATPLMVARLIDPKDWYVQMSPFQAYEVYGPGVTFLLWLSTAATVVTALVSLLLVVSHVVGEPAQLDKLAITMVSIIAMMIVANKTLSPQYIPWLAGPLAAVASFTGFDRSESPIRRWALLLLAIALLSQIVYPTLYYPLVRGDGGPGPVFLATFLLVVRNVLVAWFAIDVVRGNWKLLRRDLPAGLRRTPAGAPTAPSGR